jgi:hypothetical protein
MRRARHIRFVIAMTGCLVALASTAVAFEGRIHAVMIRGNQTDALLYTVGTNCLRVENTATNWPNPVDILDRNSGALTLLFPNNRSFVRVPSAPEETTAPGAPAMPAMPNMSASAGGGMPVMPMPPMVKLELKATGETTNLLGYTCARYEIKQRGETMEIWATDQLFPFQPYVQNQPRRFGPRMIEEQWAELAKAQKLFPLLATLKLNQGPERFRYEVKSITPQKLTDEDAPLFQPPPDYLEIHPLPF